MTSMKTRFAVFVITYNRPHGLSKVLEALLQQTYPPSQVLVVDNGNSAITADTLRSFDDKRIHHHEMGDNLGPAGAAAYGISWLVKQGFDWIGWADDNDPPLVSNAFERLLTIALTAKYPRVGAVGAVGARWNWKLGEFVRLSNAELKGILSVDTIGGGNQFIQSAEVVETVGLPDSRLFFGLFDPEYCLRIQSAGYELLVDGDLMLEYRRLAGRLTYQQTRRIVPRYHYDSIWQQYYRTRNYIYMMRRTFGSPHLARKQVLKALGRSVGSWSKGPRYGAKYTEYELRGVIDGYQDRLGRTFNPSAREGKAY